MRWRRSVHAAPRRGPDRGTFHRILGGALAAGAIGVRAQPANRVYRVGVLRPRAAPPTLGAVLAEVVWAHYFARMGYREGRNVHLDQRHGDGDPKRLLAPARDVVQQSADVIVAVAPGAVRAALEATATIPIVFLANFDPVASAPANATPLPGSSYRPFFL